MTSGARSLWRHADFLRLWAAQAISAFGSRITRTALPILAVTTLGSPEAILGVLAAMQLVPGVILATVAGGFVDRGSKRRILIAADVVRAVLVASLTLAWLLDALAMTQVIVVGAAVGAASALFQITDVAYLPMLVGRRHLVEGNAKLETTEAIAEITGPASAGVLIAALGAPLAVAIDAVSYLWSALMLGRIRAVEPAASASGAVRGDANALDASTRDASTLDANALDANALEGSARDANALEGSALDANALEGSALDANALDANALDANALDANALDANARDANALEGSARDAAAVAEVEPRAEASASMRTGKDFRVGLAAIFGHPLVRPIVLTWMVWSVLGGFFMALYTLYCLRELALSEATFGVIIAIGGIGSLAGAALARTMSRAFGVGRTLIACAALSLACSVCIPLAASAPSHAWAIVLLGAHQLLSDGFAVGFIILSVTLRQTVLPKHLLGRANAAVHVCTQGVLPIAALAGGGLATIIGVHRAMWIGVLIGLVAPVFLWPLRHLRDMPSSDAGASDPGFAQVRH